MNPQAQQLWIPVISNAVFLGILIWFLGQQFAGVHKRIDDTVRRLETMEHRLENIEGILRDFGERITRLEERIPPLLHR